MNENLIYGKSLKNIRIRNKLTQEQVAQLTGLEAKYISHIETRKSERYNFNYA